MARNKAEIVTFKVDDTLLEAMKGIPNRSEFIRTAILAALENVCPLCKGTGILTPNQKQHWEDFAREHAVRECGECHELHLTCSAHANS
jgi:metal-responsive CopG/Arc/MetJ family transcriptional regulator